MHHFPHLWGFIGLSVNMVASVLLLWFPPKVEQYTADGLVVTDRSGGSLIEIPASSEGRRMNARRYQLRRDGFQFAFGLLFLGFFLQLLDLLTT